MQKRMDEYTIEYLRRTLFDTGKFELTANATYNDIGLDWNNQANLEKERTSNSLAVWNADMC